MNATAGVGYALLAYLTWGLVPVYWKMLAAVSATEILAHRIIWSLVLSALLLALTRRWNEVVAAIAQPRTRWVLLATGLLVASNWLVFILAVNTDRVLETSLGYFLTPLLNVALGVAFLRERLRPWQIAAVGLAAVGVGYLALDFGSLPWISLALGITFAFYGLLRKVTPVAPIPGLAVETLFLAPLALATVAWLELSGEGALSQQQALGSHVGLLLAGGGIATACPLLWFASAARRLRLSTLGLFQYVAPSVALGLAVFVYGEPFAPTHAVTFAFIWGALGIYSADSLRAGSSPQPEMLARSSARSPTTGSL